MDKQQLKQAVMAAIDARREDILSISHEIYKHPETGYREFKTTELLADMLEKEGYEVERGIAYTGCRAKAADAKAGPKIAVMGELDSVLCPPTPTVTPPPAPCTPAATICRPPSWPLWPWV